MPAPDKQLSAEQSRQIADTIREEIARRRMSRQSLAELAKLSLSTLEKVLGEAESVKAIWKPQNSTPIDAEKGATLMKLIATLEEDDDVQNVYSNFDISEEDAAKIAG